MGEIVEMDPDEPVFKHPNGRPRKYHGKDKSKMGWKDAARADVQGRFNKRRARARHGEAKVVAARKVMQEREIDEPSHFLEKRGIHTEEVAIAEGILTLEDWDNEELARGYRRNRDGRWGPPPRFVPREVQMEAFRRLVGRGERHLRTAYIRVVKNLVDMANDDEVPAKVRLEAIKEILNRTVGKVPDTLRVTQDEPWQDFLVDSYVPLSETPPLEIEGFKRPLDSLESSGDGENAPAAVSPVAAQGEPPASVTAATPSPNPRRARLKVKGKKTGVKTKTKAKAKKKVKSKIAAASGRGE